MTLQIGLNLVTLMMCVVTLAMAAAALLPHLKQALILIRDGLLWLTLLLVIGGVAVVGWGRFFRIVASREALEVRGEARPSPLMLEDRSAPAADVRQIPTQSPMAFPPASAPMKHVEHVEHAQPAFSANRSWPLATDADGKQPPSPSGAGVP